MNAPIHPSTLVLLAHAWCTVLKVPPKPKPLLEFARTLRVWARDPVTGEDRWEPFDPEGHPSQREILLAFLHGGWDELTVLGPVQDGKTFACIVCCLLYCLIELRQSAGLMLPEQDKAEEVWLEKIVPVIRASGYEWILPTEGRGAKSGASRFLRLNTGATLYLIGAGARNESAQSSFTCRFMFVDEASKIRPRWLMLAWGRTASYDTHARRTRTSTIGQDEGDDTLKAFADSTQHGNWFKCPHCVANGHASGGWQPFEFHRPAADGKPAVMFDRLHYDPDTDDTARVTACLICLHDPGHLITEAERRAALRAYRPVAAGQTVAPDGTIAGVALPNARKGIRWCSMASPIKTLGKLAKDLRKALIQRDTYNNHEPLRQYVRDECVEGYTGDREAADSHHILRCTYLAARSAGSYYALGRSERQEAGDSIHVAASLPDGVEWITVGVDVNPGGAKAPGRLYWLMEGGAGDGRLWDLAWGTVALSAAGMEANTEQLHAGLTRLRDMLMDMAANRFARPLAAVGVDVGDRQDELRLWLIRHPDWTPVKDHGGERLVVDPKYTHNGTQIEKPTHRRDFAGWVHWRWQKEPNLAGWWLAIIDTDEVRHQAQVGFLVPVGQAGAFHLPAGLVASEALVAHYCATGRIPDGKGGWRWADRKSDREHWPDYQTRRDYLACRTYAVALDYRHRRQLTIPRPPPRRRGVLGGIA